MRFTQSTMLEQAKKDKKSVRSQISSYRNMIVFHLLAMGFFLGWILREIYRRPVLEWSYALWVSCAALAVLAFDAAYFFTQWFQQHEKSELEPTWDNVTGVWSSTYFEYKLQEEIVRAGRYRYPVTLCVVDIDHFRSYNENFGLKRGDELLRQFANTLQGHIRSVDLLARSCDDTFFLLLPHTDIVRAERVVNRLMELTTQDLNCQFHAGLTTFRVGENGLQFQLRAKTALENTKRDGSRRIQCLISDGENYTAVEF